MRRISPATGVRGRVAPPGDKSISHRAAIFGALSRSGIEVENFSPGADCASTLRCLKLLGCDVDRNGDCARVSCEVLREPEEVLDAGNSGTTARLLCGFIAGAQDIFAVITGDSSLRRRPMDRVTRPLLAMGASITGREHGNKLPLALRGRRLSGGEHILPVASAQVKSALLIAGLSAQGSTTVIEPAPTRNHTELLLNYLGVPIESEGNRVTVYPCCDLPGGKWRIPGDFSSAAFWIVAAAILPESELLIEGVGVNPTRTGLLSVLKRMGLNIETRERGTSGGEPVADILVKSSSLEGTKVTPDEVPLMIDELPILAVAAARAKGLTEVRGAVELRVKESDRIRSMAIGLRKLGVDIEELPDGWKIRGPAEIAGGRVRSYGDHRVAMALTVAALFSAEPVEIAGDACVDISYPGFFDVLERLSLRRENL